MEEAEARSLICLIPARSGSKGLPGKNLARFCGKELIAWTIEQALVAGIGKVVVITDGTEIAQVADRYNVAVYQEPTDLAQDDVDMESVMSWFLGQCQQRAACKPEWLMLLQCTSPLRLSVHIREVAAIAKTNAFDSVFSVVPSAHCSWRYQGDQIQIEWPQEAEGKGRRRMLRQHAGRQVTENGAIYSVRTHRFLEEETRFCGRIHAYEMPLWTATEIDGPEELAIVELIMRVRMQLGSDGVRT